MKVVTYDEKDVYELRFPDGTSKSMISIDDTHFSMDFLLERKTPNLIPALTNAHKFRCRDDDIFICAFMKAGTHWVSEICKMLLSETTKYDPNGKERYMLEFQTPDHLDTISSPRVLNSHLLPRQLPTCIQQKKTKVIFIHRNPKDIAVSSYHHVIKLHDYACSFPAYLEVFRKQATLFHNWFDYTIAWEEAFSSQYKDTPILQLSYEDIKREGIANIRKIADFLELEHDEDFLFKVNARCGFDNMKDAKLTLAEVKKDHIQKAMYRKGQIGDWKNWFTVAENENFDADFRTRMKHSKFKYSWE
ncbi:sulfotransferase family cytosolic 1B member 1-like isoform X2 [Mizuhopecten yessoensis]|uniref:sulfotransferase family cytosolic 1B member 1-like isoform X2 n=1 Tax=Mizuhopecten yessoensis TaxID=6573 RepID=UPI000B4588CF|nr:sulfotransferase family cytosolic 1B member 1-like isoform X2 [Mizuhopecten yessoensis]